MRALGLILAIGLWTMSAGAAVQDEGLTFIPEAPRAVQTKRINLDADRAIVAEIQKPRNRRFPTLLFMPGIAAKIPVSHPALVALAAKGFGIVTMNVSTQPASVFALKAGEKPEFRSRIFTVQDLAWEVEELAKILRKTKSLENLIPVSLSFSAAMSAYLRSFPFIIETVPLTSSDTANPTGENYRTWLKNINAFNFFGAEAAVRSGMDDSYRDFWAPQVEEGIKTGGWPEERREDMIEGYVSMSRSVEGYDIQNVQLPADVERFFLIAGQEKAGMKRHQIKTVERLRKEGFKVAIEELPEAGHLIMESHEAYVEAVAKAALAFDCKKVLKP